MITKLMQVVDKVNLNIFIVFLMNLIIINIFLQEILIKNYINYFNKQNKVKFLILFTILNIIINKSQTPFTNLMIINMLLASYIDRKFLIIPNKMIYIDIFIYIFALINHEVIFIQSEVYLKIFATLAIIIVYLWTPISNKIGFGDIKMVCVSFLWINNLSKYFMISGLSILIEWMILKLIKKEKNSIIPAGIHFLIGRILLII